MKQLVRRSIAAYDRFWFQSCDPRYCSVMRIACGLLMLVFVGIWWLDAALWFSAEGVLQADSAHRIARGQHWSILFYLPDNVPFISVCLGVMWLQSLLLLLGVASRFQALSLFIWITSFQNRNPLITDGEDTVLRFWLFFMMLMPLDYCWSGGRWLWNRWRGGSAQPASQSSESEVTWSGIASAWGLRLVQFEVTAIYLSTAWSKWQGETWRDGSALFYVSRMDDVFGRLWLPETLFVTDWMLRLSTWSVLGVETLLPLLLWLPYTRRLGVVLAIGLHLAIEYAMHLFLFEWIMIAGLLSFLAVRKVPKSTASPDQLSPVQFEQSCVTCDVLTQDRAAPHAIPQA